MRVKRRNGFWQTGEFFLPLILLALVVFLSIANLHAEELQSGSSGDLIFELRPLPGSITDQTPGQLGVELSLSSSKSPLPDPEVSTLSNPTRVVIDLPGVKTNSKSIKLNSYGVTALRFGRHPERARVVLDLEGNKEVHFRVSHGGVGEASGDNGPDKRSLIVTISRAGSGTNAPAAAAASSMVATSSEAPVSSAAAASLSSALSSSSSSSSSSSAASSSSSSSSEVAILAAPEVVAIQRTKPTSSRSVSSRPSEESVPAGEEFAPTLGTLEASSSASSLSSSAPAAVRVAPTETIGGAHGQAATGDGVVRGIAFQKNERGTGVVIIDVSNLSHYSVTRAQDNVFEVVIDDAHLGGAQLELPQFPPDYFEGLEVVRAHNRSRNVVIELFVEDAIKVTPYASKGQLNIGLGY